MRIINKILSRIGLVLKKDYEAEKEELLIKICLLKRDLISKEHPQIYFNDSQIDGIINDKVTFYQQGKIVNLSLALDSDTYEKLIDYCIKHCRSVSILREYK